MMFYMLVFGSVISTKLINKKVSIMILNWILLMEALKLSQSMVLNNLNWVFSDFISEALIMLSIWIVILTILATKWNKEFFFLSVSMLMLLVITFSQSNLIMFYIFFELVLIPMFLMISKFGYQPERLESAIYMSFYTVTGSLPLLMNLLYMYHSSFNVNWIYSCYTDSFKILSFMSSMAFLVKLPSFSLHLWLPKAHVEAPLGGSMMLAGILLKLGSYGILRFISIFCSAPMMQSLLMMTGLWGAILVSFNCLSQLDMKKLIAYSSVVHMGLMLSGLMTQSSMGTSGASIIMMSHGFCSSGMFFISNLFYQQIHTRNFLLLKGLLSLNPKVVMWLFFLSAANMAAPPFISMIGEIFLGNSLIMFCDWLSILLILIYFLPVCYSMYFFSVISHGNPNSFKSLSPSTNFDYLILFLHLIPVLLMILKLELFMMI